MNKTNMNKTIDQTKKSTSKNDTFNGTKHANNKFFWIQTG